MKSYFTFIIGIVLTCQISLADCNLEFKDGAIDVKTAILKVNSNAITEKFGGSLHILLNAFQNRKKLYTVEIELTNLNSLLIQLQNSVPNYELKHKAGKNYLFRASLESIILLSTFVQIHHIHLK